MSSDSMAVNKRAQQQDAALQQGSVVQRVLQLAGPRQHLYTGAICKHWLRVREQMWAPTERLRTSDSAVFGSRPRLLMACECGFSEVLALTSGLEQQPLANLYTLTEQWAVDMRADRSRAEAVSQTAGGYADLDTLRLAISLGLRPNRPLLLGAVYVGALDKVQFLWPLVKGRPAGLGHRAACSGSVEVLVFLVAQGAELQENTMQRAAARGDASMVQYLSSVYGVQDDWGKALLTGAASGGHLRLLEWAQSEGIDIHEHKAALAQTAETLCVRQQGRLLWSQVLLLQDLLPAGR